MSIRDVCRILTGDEPTGRPAIDDDLSGGRHADLLGHPYRADIVRIHVGDDAESYEIALKVGDS